MSLPHYPEYKPSGVEWLGEVPGHWEVKRLKQVADVRLSNVDKHSLESQPSVRLCNYVDVYKNDRITSVIEFMQATASEEQIARLSLLAGDVIITKDSEVPSDIGVPALVNETIPDLVCGYHLALIRPTHAAGGYLRYLFKSDFVKAVFEVEATGMTRYALGKYSIENLVHPAPPLEEQQAIATFLDRETRKIDALIAEQKWLVELLAEKRQAVIFHAVTKGLNPNALMKDSGIEWLGEVPEHWEVKPMRMVANVVRGASPRPAGDPRYFGGDAVPWVTVGEITKDDSVYLTETETWLTQEGAEHSNLFPSGTVIYSNSGATLGVPKVLSIHACANDGVVAFLNLNSQVKAEFLYHYLASITDSIREKVKQGSGQPNLNTDIVKNLRFGLPPLDEQKSIVLRITELADQFGSLTAEANRAISLLQERRSALISAAVTGKIDVRDALA